MAFSATPFRAGAEGEDALLAVGAVVELEGVFDGSESAGGIAGVICRAANSPRRYHVRVLAVQDDYLAWHLLESNLLGSTVLFRLATGTAADEEVSISWRTLVAAGDPDCARLDSVDWLSQKDVDRLPRGVAFCREMMMAAVTPGVASLPRLVSASWDEHF